jgi:hypothetical protein
MSNGGWKLSPSVQVCVCLLVLDKEDGISRPAIYDGFRASMSKYP